jgi:beta-glucanase (GH16 family)
MLSKSFTAAAAVLAASRLVSAQTHTDCNPQEKDCGSDVALGREVFVDFTQGEHELFYEFDGTTVEYNENGAVFTIEDENDAPTMGSTEYIFFGKVELTVQAAPGTGIVTSFVLQSDNLDEIDWEWLGYHPDEVQTNYFGKGDDSTFDRGGFHDVPGVQTEQHTYTIDWTKEYVRWSVNGNQIRELLYADAKGGSRFPQTPMQIRLGTWVAGRSDAPQGTVEWAGGLADFSNGPAVAYYKSLKITDYSNGVESATEYEWAPAPNDGSYEDITVITGDGPADKPETSITSTPKPTHTSTTMDGESSRTEGSSSATATASTTGSASATPSASEGSSSSATGGSAAPSATGAESPSSTGAAGGAAASPSGSAIPTADAFKTSFSAVLAGAGLLVALAL